MQLISTMENIDIGLLKVWDKAEKMFPEYSSSQYKDLQDFITLHGQPLPLVVSETMKIVDGYNRYRLYLQAGINTVTVQVYSYKNEAEMEIHAIALNAKRRHLDAVHSARAAKKLSILYKPNPADTLRKRIEAGKKGGRGREQIDNTSQDVVSISRPVSAIEKAAKAVGVSINSIKMVSIVDETKDSLLIKAMEQGKISIGKAYELSFLSHAERKKHLTQTITDSEKQLARATGMIQYLHGDCIEVMKTLKDKSVFACVTSPPYWGVRDFGGKGQIGVEGTLDEYIENMVKVFREVKRILRDDGTLWINMGDAYVHSSVERRNDQSLNQYPSKRKHNANIIRGEANGCKEKDLIGLPWMLAFALRNDGWYLRSDIIWHKPSANPESAPDRPMRSHEYIFLMSKNKKYYYDRESIKENSMDSHKHYFSEESRYKRTVWTIDREPFYGSHSASFPEKLIEPCILAGSPKNGWVLDPFAGSGTTGIVSQRYNRNCILIDINEENIQMQKERTRQQFFKSDRVDWNKVRKIIRKNNEE